MFAAGYFAKGFFPGSYFAPNDSGGFEESSGQDTFKGMILNIGRMSVRGR